MQDKILFLNASNYRGNLVYPYAFVQITEIASRYGIKVFREDLFGIEVRNWKKLLEERFSKYDFRAVFITIRNLDTGEIHQYPPEILHQTGSQEVYYPLVLTRQLVQVIREISNVPIVIGGFGYSIIPEKILRFIKADFGVIGGSEGLFENFQVLNEPDITENVPNLYYNNNDLIKSGPRKFYGPANTQEYTDTIVKEIKEFNSIHQEKEDVTLVTTIAVEISRGCPYNCSFCCEPLVVGNLMQYRNIDAIIDDIQFLQKHGFYEIFFACSELNPMGNDFVIKLSERIYNLNVDSKEKEKIKWGATYLMNFTLEEFNVLKKSGFVGGWYDVVSLEDENLKSTNAPYKSQEILETISNLDGGLKGGFILEDEILTRPERIYYNKPKTHTGSFFLGNPQTTTTTIRKTLQNAHKYRLDEIYDKTGINYATRVYDYINLTDNELRATYSIDFEGMKVDYNDLYPSFTYPPELLDHFNSSKDLRDFFTYIQTTFLSSGYLFNIDWQKFVQENLELNVFYQLWLELETNEISNQKVTTVKEIRELLDKLSYQDFQEFYSKQYQGSELIHISSLINSIIQLILIHNNQRISKVLKFFKLPENIFSTFSMTVYEVMKNFYTRFNSIEDLSNFKNKQLEGSLDKLFVDYFWVLKNIKLETILIPFFFEP